MFSLNSPNSVTKIISFQKRITVFEPCYILCKKTALYLSNEKTQVREEIFKLTSFHASVIFQVPWNRWIQWISLPFRENPIWVFRWFKFTLKPPNSIMPGNLLSAIWDTSHWNFFVKFGLKTAWHISYDILWSLLSYVNFWRLQGHLSTFAKIWGPQKIKVFLMKERSVVDEAWGF